MFIKNKLIPSVALALSITSTSINPIFADTSSNATIDVAILQQMLNQSLSNHPAMCSDDYNRVSGPDMDEMLYNLYANTTSQAEVSSSISKARVKKKGLNRTYSEAQVVYLDFETGEPTFPAGGLAFLLPEGVGPNLPDYVYSQEEKDEIQQRLEADYAGLNVTFTQTLPESGDFVFLQFNSNDNPGQTAGIFNSGGILFGRAGEIEFGNNNKSIGAIVDANLWQLLYFADPSGNFLAAVAGIEITPDSDPLEILSQAMVNQSANTGAHEVGHTLGLRHYDAFGDPGDGLPSTGSPAPSRFFPAYTGNQLAVETLNHTMASGASSGIGLADSGGKDRFFSERSLIKLRINDLNGTSKSIINSEEDVAGKIIPFSNGLQVPNNLLSGNNAFTNLKVRNIALRGRIGELDEVDTYRFNAKAGSIISIEAISDVDFLNTDIMFTRVRLFRQENDGSFTFVDENISEFESRDSFLLDVPITQNGTYLVAVDGQPIVELNRGRTDAFVVPFTVFSLATQEAFRIGNYALNVYAVEDQF